jgi:hypothetical protein
MSGVGFSKIESVAICSQAGTLSLHLTNCSFGKRQRALNADTALSCCLHVDRARIHIFIRMDGKVVGLGRPLILSCDQTLWRRFSTLLPAHSATTHTARIRKVVIS